jgi:CheY-like chemotaxis protein
LDTIPCIDDNRGAPSFRVLVIEDHETFRRFLCSTLEKRTELQVICEASDGLEAVRKAEELQPDLILLDVGLPTLNGIEAARKIRKLSPESKILFVSQESSAEVVREAIGLGAHGYIVKSDVGSDLLEGVTAVLRGDLFFGRRFSGDDFVGGSDAGTSQKFRSKSVFAPLPDPDTAHRHEARFYSDDECFLDSFTRFIEAPLKAGSAAIVIATESHRDSLLARLQILGLDIGAAMEEGRYLSLDAAGTVASFMVNDLPDPWKFLKVTGDLIAGAADAAKKDHRRVVACGECAPLLWARGNAEAAIRLEHLWDDIAKSHNIRVLCGYPLDSFQGGLGSHIFRKICAAHSAVHSL